MIGDRTHLNMIQTGLDTILENWKTVIIHGIYNRAMLTDEIEKMLTEVRSDIELVEETIKSNKNLGNVRITISTNVGIFTSRYPDKSPGPLSSRTDRSEINIPSEFEYTPLKGDTFSHSMRLKDGEFKEGKAIIIKETSFNDLEQGSTFIDFHTYYSVFMNDPKFYHQLFHGDEDIITFVTNEHLKTVQEDLDELLKNLGEIILGIKTMYTYHSNSIKNFEKKLNMGYPEFSNIRFVDDTSTYKRSVVFEWLNRTWMIYV